MVDMGQIYKFIQDNKLIFFPVLFVLGLLLAFFGVKMNKLTFFLAGFLIGSGFILVIF